MNRIFGFCFSVFLGLGAFALFLCGSVLGAEAEGTRSPGFYFGAASVSITPDQSIYLAGQFNARFSKGAAAPITANAAVTEYVSADGKSDYAIFVSMDIISISSFFKDKFHEAFKAKFPELSTQNLILCATHTHTSGIMAPRPHVEMPEGTMTSEAFVQMILDRTIPAIETAWKNRKPAKYSYGLDFAVVAYNRRAVYANGNAVMYGKTNDPNFRCIEGMEDHDVNSMFFWDENDKLLGMFVNVSCPSQEVESDLYIDPDFWGPTRDMIQEKYGKDVVVLAMCGAAGDLSPHIRYRVSAEERMRKLRQLNRKQEIGRRIFEAVSRTYETAALAKSVPSCVKSLYAEVDLPQRKVTEAEYLSAKAEAEKLFEEAKKSKNASHASTFGRANWNKRIIARWEGLKTNPNPTYKTAFHVVRIGDAVLCTNQFELYTDFGVQIKARSRAVQTFVVQLCDGVEGGGTYLPSKRAVEGGGYGAVIQSNTVGHEGGQVLVEKTLEMINEVFPQE